MVIEIGTVVGLLLQLNYGPGPLAPYSIYLNTWKSPQSRTLLDSGPLFGTHVGPYSGEGRGLGLYPTLEPKTPKPGTFASILCGGLQIVQERKLKLQTYWPFQPTPATTSQK
jgi:hypothetical protein